MEIKIKLEEDGKITREITDFAGPEVFMRVLFSLMKNELDNLNKHLDLHADEETKKILKEEMFDLVNYSASHILQECFPEFELRPGLTEEAILEMENQLIDQKYDELMKNKGSEI